MKRSLSHSLRLLVALAVGTTLAQTASAVSPPIHAMHVVDRMLASLHISGDMLFAMKTGTFVDGRFLPGVFESVLLKDNMMTVST